METGPKHARITPEPTGSRAQEKMIEGRPADVTQILRDLQRGDREARDKLFAAVYGELKQLAHSRRRSEGAGNTLQTTALVHEAYLRLCGPHSPSFENRQHFFGIAARAMRQILVDHARQRKAAKRGGGIVEELNTDCPAATQDPDEVLTVDELLDRLAEDRPRHAEVVTCRFFVGMTVEETADLLGISTRQVEKDWEVARAWMKSQLSRGTPGSD